MAIPRINYTIPLTTCTPLLLDDSETLQVSYIEALLLVG